MKNVGVKLLFLEELRTYLLSVTFFLNNKVDESLSDPGKTDYNFCLKMKMTKEVLLKINGLINPNDVTIPEGVSAIWCTSTYSRLYFFG